MTTSPHLPLRRPISGAPLDPLPAFKFPARTPLAGDRVWLEPLDAAHHAADLCAVSHADAQAQQIWTYLGYGPFADVDSFAAWLRECMAVADPIFYAVCERASQRAAGMVSYLNIDPRNGSIEMGHIWFAPFVQRTPAATEALFLLMRHALDDLGYRRLEWKCDARNAASRNAALRLGFRFEGIFYNHRITKGRNRDTTWFSIIDSEWPTIRPNIETWLSPENFDANGQQRRSLRALNQAE